MAWHWYALRVIQTLEDRIIEVILRQPGFHRVVGRIHKTIHERRHGRMPHEPLHPGEATGMSNLHLDFLFTVSEKVLDGWVLTLGVADPNMAEKNQSFFRHFRQELANQFRGRPTDIAEKPTTTMKKRNTR